MSAAAFMEQSAARAFVIVDAFGAAGRWTLKAVSATGKALWWTVKVLLALCGVLLGVFLVVACARYLVQPDVVLSPFRDAYLRGYSTATRMPLTLADTREALHAVRSMLLTYGVVGCAFIAFCGHWLARWWSNVVCGAWK